MLELEPLSGDAPVPPGLTDWLEPGQIAVSSAAHEYVDVLERQFGPVAQVIDDDVVLDGELIVYYRPSDGAAFVDTARAEAGVYFSAGFAGAEGEGALFGDIEYEQWSQYLLPVALLVFAFPLILNIRTTKASVDEALAGERFALQSIGAPRRELIRHSIRFLIRPYVIGAGLAIVITGVFVSGALRLPITGFQLHTVLYVSKLPALVGFLVVATCSIFFYLSWPRLYASHQRATKQRSIGTRTGLIFFSIGILVAAIIGIFFRKIPDSLVVALILSAVLFTLLGLHSALALLCKVATDFVVKRESTDIRSAVFFGWISTHPYQASRTGVYAGSFVTVGVLLVAIFNIIAGAQIPPPKHPDNIQVVQTSISCVENQATCLGDAAQTIHEQNPDAAVYVATYGQGSAEVSTGTVDPSFLHQFVQQRLTPEYGPQVEEITLESRWAWIYTVSSQEQDLLAEIQSIDFGTAILPLSISDGEDGRAIAAIYRQQATWLTLLTILAFVWAMASVWMQYARETSSHAKEFASIASLTGKADTIARTTAMRHTLVNAVTGLASLGTGIFLTTQFFFPFGEFMPWAFIVAIAFIYVVFILTQALLMYLLVRKEAVRWLPGKS
ncbi:MAG: hypothetical protein Q4E03_00955 [Trueperella sp.]|nr:hypothetical protein [Trueperella sp.]